MLATPCVSLCDVASSIRSWKASWWEDRERSFVADSFTIGTEAHRLSVRTSSPVHVELSPIKTVSNSESGIETIYQGMTVSIALDLRTSRHLTLEIGG